MRFKDPLSEEQRRLREVTWESLNELMGQPKTPQLIDLILKTCREALDGEYFVTYHDMNPETDLLLLLGKKTDSGLYTIDSILINDMFKKEEVKNA